MKQFIFGFILGAVVMVGAGTVWGTVMPDFLGGRWDVTTPNPLISNPISLSCNKLTANTSQFGNVEVKVIKNGEVVKGLDVLLSIESPPLAPYQNSSIMAPIPKKACFVVTDNKGIGTFKNVPASTAYLFFNNDPGSYPKKFGQPNLSITKVDVSQSQTASVTINLDISK